jgi:hypothetical protein
MQPSVRAPQPCNPSLAPGVRNIISAMRDVV